MEGWNDVVGFEGKYEEEDEEEERLVIQLTTSVNVGATVHRMVIAEVEWNLRIFVIDEHMILHIYDLQESQVINRQQVKLKKKFSACHELHAAPTGDFVSMLVEQDGNQSFLLYHIKSRNEQDFRVDEPKPNSFQWSPLGNKALVLNGKDLVMLEEVNGMNKRSLDIACQWFCWSVDARSIWSVEENLNRIVIKKIDPETSDVLDSWSEEVVKLPGITGLYVVMMRPLTMTNFMLYIRVNMSKHDSRSNRTEKLTFFYYVYWNLDNGAVWEKVKTQGTPIFSFGFQTLCVLSGRAFMRFKIYSFRDDGIYFGDIYNSGDRILIHSLDHNRELFVGSVRESNTHLIELGTLDVRDPEAWELRYSCTQEDGENSDDYRLGFTATQGNLEAMLLVQKKIDIGDNDSNGSLNDSIGSRARSVRFDDEQEYENEEPVKDEFSGTLDDISGLISSGSDFIFADDDLSENPFSHETIMDEKKDAKYDTQGRSDLMLSTMDTLLLGRLDKIQNRIKCLPACRKRLISKGDNEELLKYANKVMAKLKRVSAEYQVMKLLEETPHFVNPFFENLDGSVETLKSNVDSYIRELEEFLQQPHHMINTHTDYEEWITLMKRVAERHDRFLGIFSCQRDEIRNRLDFLKNRKSAQRKQLSESRQLVHTLDEHSPALDFSYFTQVLIEEATNSSLAERAGSLSPKKLLPFRGTPEVGALSSMTKVLWEEKEPMRSPPRRTQEVRQVHHTPNIAMGNDAIRSGPTEPISQERRSPYRMEGMYDMKSTSLEKKGADPTTGMIPSSQSFRAELSGKEPESSQPKPSGDSSFPPFNTNLSGMKPEISHPKPSGVASSISFNMDLSGKKPETSRPKPFGDASFSLGLNEEKAETSLEKPSDDASFPPFNMNLSGKKPEISQPKPSGDASFPPFNTNLSGKKAETSLEKPSDDASFPPFNMNLSGKKPETSQPKPSGDASFPPFNTNLSGMKPESVKSQSPSIHGTETKVVEEKSSMNQFFVPSNSHSSPFTDEKRDELNEESKQRAVLSGIAPPSRADQMSEFGFPSTGFMSMNDNQGTFGSTSSGQFGTGALGNDVSGAFQFQNPAQTSHEGPQQTMFDSGQGSVFGSVERKTFSPSDPNSTSIFSQNPVSLFQQNSADPNKPFGASSDTSFGAGGLQPSTSLFGSSNGNGQSQGTSWMTSSKTETYGQKGFGDSAYDFRNTS